MKGFQNKVSRNNFDMNTLLLFLMLDKEKTGVGNMPDATIVLTNEGTVPLVVNARLLMMPGRDIKNSGEVFFSIDGPPGSLNLKLFQVNAGPASAEDFIELFPGQTILKTYSLKKYFSYSDPGLYKVSVKYSNKVDIELNNLRSWIGVLTSNTVNFDLE